VNSEDKRVLEEARVIHGAKPDLEDRYYIQDTEGYRSYGYNSGITGAYVCFTCGLLCECGEEGEK
jgi:hypothetical protein